MKNNEIADKLFDMIIEREKPKLENIMRHMTEQIKNDFVQETYRLLDIYYENYTPRVYIRTDELRGKVSKNGRFRGKNGKFLKPSKTIQDRLANDRSLKEAMKTPGSIGVARLAESGWGYIGGIIFDEADADYHLDMKHSNRGIEEFDIVTNFLFSDDANQTGNAAAQYRNFPSANVGLEAFLKSYDKKIDKMYTDACAKFR